jgi:hypothetical protein
MLQKDSFKEYSHRLSRVTAAVSYCYYLVAQKVWANLAQALFYFARTFRKGGDYVIWHSSQYCDSSYGGNLGAIVLVIHNSA